MSSWSLSALLRPELAELSAYVPVAGDFGVRLDANEAPPLLGEAARRRLAEVAAGTAWERYPDARCTDLRRAIAQKHGVTPEEVLVGTGSDEVITMLLTALAQPRLGSPAPTIVTTTPTFVMYRLSGRVRGMQVLEVPLDPDWDLPDGSVLRALDVATPNLVFIATPNNPTGNPMKRERLINVIEAARESLVVIDEAYVDYAASHNLDLYREYENVAILRTLSKVGFAALRVGWLFGRPELVSELDKVRSPYNVPSASQRLAVTVLDELGDEIGRIAAEVIAERERLSLELGKLPGIAVTPSQANFLWVKTERAAGEVFSALAEKKVLVRSFHARGGRLAHQLRVTIGTRAENDTFLAALREVVRE